MDELDGTRYYLEQLRAAPNDPQTQLVFHTWYQRAGTIAAWERYKKSFVSLEDKEASQLQEQRLETMNAQGSTMKVLVAPFLSSSKSEPSMEDWIPSFFVTPSGYLSKAAIAAAETVILYIRERFDRKQVSGSTREERLASTRTHLKSIVDQGVEDKPDLNREMSLVPEEAAGRAAAASMGHAGESEEVICPERIWPEADASLEESSQDGATPTLSVAVGSDLVKMHNASTSSGGVASTSSPPAGEQLTRL